MKIPGERVFPAGETARAKAMGGQVLAHTRNYRGEL